jgi:hypothetical protein
MMTRKQQQTDERAQLARSAELHTYTRAHAHTHTHTHTHTRIRTHTRTLIDFTSLGEQAVAALWEQHGRLQLGDKLSESFSRDDGNGALMPVWCTASRCEVEGGGWC